MLKMRKQQIDKLIKEVIELKHQLNEYNSEGYHDIFGNIIVLKKDKYYDINEVIKSIANIYRIKNFNKETSLILLESLNISYDLIKYRKKAISLYKKHIKYRNIVDYGSLKNHFKDEAIAIKELVESYDLELNSDNFPASFDVLDMMSDDLNFEYKKEVLEAIKLFSHYRRNNVTVTKKNFVFI